MCLLCVADGWQLISIRCIIRDRSAVARSQFVFSAAVAIGIRNGLNRGTQRTSGVSILRLAGDAAAVVVGILE